MSLLWAAEIFLSDPRVVRLVGREVRALFETTAFERFVKIALCSQNKGADRSC